VKRHFDQKLLLRHTESFVHACATVGQASRVKGHCKQNYVWYDDGRLAVTDLGYSRPTEGLWNATDLTFHLHFLNFYIFDICSGTIPSNFPSPV